MLNRRRFLQSSFSCTVAGSVAASLQQVAALADRSRGERVLPYDNTNPVVYDNDWTNDYVDWYLMALASADDINNAGMCGFNGWSDGWAAYIVLKKLRLVQFTVQSKSAARIPKKRLLELPDSPARDFMIASTPDVAAPKGDADGPPAISLMRSDYIKEIMRVSFRSWKKRGGHEMPMFGKDPNGRAIVVTAVDRNVATKEWFRAMKNPGAWHARGGAGSPQPAKGRARK